MTVERMVFEVKFLDVQAGRILSPVTMQKTYGEHPRALSPEEPLFG